MLNASLFLYIFTGIDFDIRLDRKPGKQKKVLKLIKLKELLLQEQVIHDELKVLVQGNPLDNYDQLVACTSRAAALNMSQYPMYAEVLQKAIQQQKAVSEIAQTKLGLQIGVDRNDSNGLLKCIEKAKA